MKIGKKSLLIQYQEGYIRMGTLLQTHYKKEYNLDIYPRIFWRCALDHAAGTEYALMFGTGAPIYKHIKLPVLKIVCKRLSRYYKNSGVLAKDMSTSNHYRRNYKGKTHLIDENIIEQLLPF